MAITQLSCPAFPIPSSCVCYCSGVLDPVPCTLVFIHRCMFGNVAALEQDFGPHLGIVRFAQNCMYYLVCLVYSGTQLCSAANTETSRGSRLPDIALCMWSSHTKLLLTH